MPSPRLALAPALLLALLLAAPGPAAADGADVEPPEVSWCPNGKVLTVKVKPTGDSHLSPDLPLDLVLDDGALFVVRWRESELPETGPAKIRLPRVAGDGSEGFTLAVSGGVCNDDESICLPFHIATELPRRGGRGKGVAQAGPPPRAPSEPGRSAPPSPRPPPLRDVGVPVRDADSGMLNPGARWYSVTDDGDPVAAAFADASESGRNVLIDFWARWCPPCDRLREEFLEDHHRFALLSGFVLLKADADHPASFALKDRYKVGGYPTLLVVDGEGRELDRIVGYGSDPDGLAARLDGVKEAKGWDAPPEGTPIAEQLRRLVAADRTDEAWAIVAAMEPPAAEQLDGDFAALELALAAADAADDGDQRAIDLMLAAAEAAPTPGGAAGWAEAAASSLDLAERSEEAAAVRGDFGARLDAVVGGRSPVTTTLGRGWTSVVGHVPEHETVAVHDDLANAAWYRAQWTDEGTARTLRAEGAVRIAAAILFEEAKAAPEIPRLPDGRASIVVPDQLLAESLRPRLPAQAGRIHDVLSLLRAAELPDAAEPLYLAMIELFPEDFTWRYAYAGFLRDFREGAGGVEQARIAHEHSYGDNRLRASYRLAELLHAAGETDEALATVDAALTAPVPEQEDVRTHRYRTKLEELKAGWQADEPR